MNSWEAEQSDYVTNSGRWDYDLNWNMNLEYALWQQDTTFYLAENELLEVSRVHIYNGQIRFADRSK